MNELISFFCNVNFILLSLGIYFATLTVRTILEYLILRNPNFPGNPKSPFWTQLFLPLFPIILGASLPFFTSSIYPAMITGELLRGLFGLVAGGVSTTLYRVITGLLFKQVDLPPPPAVFDTTNFPSSTTVVVNNVPAAPQDPPKAE